MHYLKRHENACHSHDRATQMYAEYESCHQEYTSLCFVETGKFAERWLWNSTGITYVESVLGRICPLAASESGNTTSSALLESHVKSLLLERYETTDLTATRENTLLFQLALLLPCCSATILSHPILLFLIVNDFFKCKGVSLTLSLGRCHIPRCKFRG